MLASIPIKEATCTTRTTCPYCGVGCGVLVDSVGSQIVGVRGDPDHPANFGRLCTKGSTLHLTATAAIQSTSRLVRPRMRDARGGPWRDAPWDDAMDTVTSQLARVVREHGPDAVGIYASGQLLTEDYYVFNKFTKGLLGTNNLDTNSRLCMSSSVVGYKQSLGADAPPACYDDLNHAHCVFIAGSNAAWAHPVLYRRLEDARRANPAMKLIVVDPRRTETADDADLHLAIEPGTDVALFHGMLHAMIWDDLIDRAYIDAHTVGFDALKRLVRDHTPQAAARRCGITPEALLQAARWFAESPSTLSMYCQGLNQSSSGTAKNTALINLHLATGHIGRKGAGPLSLTGQPNAMGGREVGGMATLLSAHRDLSNAAHRDEVAALWGVQEVPSKPGLTAVEMFEAAANGTLKALWIACTNPAQSMPDQTLVRAALNRCEFVVVQDAYADIATAAFADVLLPATTWGEKEGTVTNSERCISRVRAAVTPPGEARHDWRIVCDVAKRLAVRLVAEKTRATTQPLPTFDYANPEAIWLEHRASTRGRDLDITGLSYALLEAKGPQQWPMPEGAVGGRSRLYEDGQFPTADGRARFIASPDRQVAERRDANYPFALTTTRLRDQWHGMSRSGRTARLLAHEAQPLVRMHPQDIDRRRLPAGELVRVQSRRGSFVATLRGDDRVSLGVVDIPMHWGDGFVGGHGQGLVGGVNALTTRATCPDSKQPELKHAAVRVESVDLPWRLMATAWFDDEARALQVQARWRERMADAEHTQCISVSGPNGRMGLRFDAASTVPMTQTLGPFFEASMQLTPTASGRYHDARRDRLRTLAFEGPRDALTLRAVLVVGESSQGQWLGEVWRSSDPVQAYGRALLSPDAVAPELLTPRDPLVCLCLGIGEGAIQRAVAQGQGDAATRLAGAQRQLACGTQCGSCLPALRRMAAFAVAQHAALPHATAVAPPHPMTASTATLT